MTRRLLCLALCSVVLGPPSASAQTPASAPGAAAWGTLLVPGGFSALQRAGRMAGPVEDWRTIPVVIELSFAGSEGLRYTRSLGAYGALLRKLHRQASAISADRRVSLAARDKHPSDVDELFQTLGLEYDGRTNTVRVRSHDAAQPESLVLLERAGLQARDLAERLNRGEAVSLATVDATAPLPLGTAFWEGRFEPTPPPHDLLFAILASREMSSLYYGLLGLDDETLEAVQGDSKLATALVRYALVLPVVADALRIERGQIVPAGGNEMAAAWQELVGEPLARPAAFIEDLLRADEGRQALFYRTLWALPEGRARLIAGVPAGSRDGGRNLRRLYEAFKTALEGWRADALISPPAFGPAEVLFSLAMRDDGGLAGPSARAFWQKVFESSAWPAQPERELARVDARDPLDAAGLLELVCPGLCDRERLGVVMLIQREFRNASPATMPYMLSAGRCRMRYPSLALEIERMRLADPSAYSALGSVASRLEDLDTTARTVALVQYQSAVALLARMRAVGAPAATVRHQAGALAALPLTKNGFEGGLLRWAVGLFAPQEGESLDAAAARTLAGEAWQPAGETFVWEDLTYRVDVAATENVRIRAALEKFTANSLDAAAAFVRLSDELPDRVGSGGVEAFVTAVEEAASAATDVGPVWWAGSPTGFDSVREVTSDLADGLRRARTTDRRALERSIQSLRAVADLAGADALAALVYALALHDVDGELALSRELPRRHHFVPEGVAGNRATTWAIPTERYPDGAARHISGSLLALDVGIPHLAIRRLSAGRPSEEPNMAPTIAVGLLRTAVLAAPWTVRAEDLAAIHEAYVRGVAIQQKWSTNGDGEGHVSEAGVFGPLAGWLRWEHGRGEPLKGLGDLTDLVRLGSLPSSLPSSWGAAQPLSACLCLAMPGRASLIRGSSRDAETIVATLVEPALRVAVELQRRRAPAALASGVLMLLVTDVIDAAVLANPMDARGIIKTVGSIPTVRFDDYIAAVAARGPLVRVADAARGSQ